MCFEVRANRRLVPIIFVISPGYFVTRSMNRVSKEPRSDPPIPVALSAAGEVNEKREGRREKRKIVRKTYIPRTGARGVRVMTVGVIINTI